MKNPLTLHSAKNSTGQRCYKTQLNLEQALIRFNINDLPHVICKTVEGDFTALFVANSSNFSIEPARRGFMMVGQI